VFRDNTPLEIDPQRIDVSNDLHANREALIAVTDMFLNRIVDSAHRCPQLLKEIFNDLRQVAAHEYGGKRMMSWRLIYFILAQHVDVQRLVLSSFLIMRFFAAAIHNPKMFLLRRENPVGGNKTFFFK
jgi:Ras GTPase-activating protein 3